MKFAERLRIALIAFAALSPAATSAQERGTMDLAPSSSIAVAMSDEELGKQRGGFMGIAFSATFTAVIDNLNAPVTGTGSTTSTTSGVTNTSLPATYNITGGQVTASAFIGNLNNVSGVFNIVQVPGSFNVVNSNLVVNIAVVNVLNSAQVPSLTTLFGP
jgi:hypothetical protein